GSPRGPGHGASWSEYHGRRTVEGADTNGQTAVRTVTGARARSRGAATWPTMPPRGPYARGADLPPLWCPTPPGRRGDHDVRALRHGPRGWTDPAPGPTGGRRPGGRGRNAGVRGPVRGPRRRGGPDGRRDRGAAPTSARGDRAP